MLVDIGTAMRHGEMMAHSFALERFVEAQDRDGTYDAAVSELASGRKGSHWMWFVFPQLRGLGSSPMADRYGIRSREEAVAYLGHDVLGPRLHRCARLVVESGAGSAQELMGSVDGLKLRSSMTLFANAADVEAGNADFVAVLDEYFGGEPDSMTLRLLGRR